MLVNDHVYLVTGGSSGLGQATATSLLARGAFVAVLDLKAPSPGTFDNHNTSAFTNGAPETKEKRWTYVECDVGDEENVDSAIEAVKKAFEGKKWGGVIHCGGVGMAGKVRCALSFPERT
jgi:NAD(P)-dependent dehydrogenase (short-subunit alcohol dehydrogenase family)